MNKKCFTVVELITSFALTMVICIFLFEVLIDVKDIYIETAIKTNIQQKLAIVSKNIKRTVGPRGTTASCSNNVCKVNGVNSAIAITGNAIKASGQKYEMPNGVEIDPASTITSYCVENKNNCFITLNLILKSQSLKEDYNYKVVFYYYDYTSVSS